MNINSNATTIANLEFRCANRHIWVRDAIKRARNDNRKPVALPVSIEQYGRYTQTSLDEYTQTG